MEPCELHHAAWIIDDIVDENHIICRFRKLVNVFILKSPEKKTRTTFLIPREFHPQMLLVPPMMNEKDVEDFVNMYTSEHSVHYSQKNQQYEIENDSGSRFSSKKLLPGESRFLLTRKN
jgi:saccharopine dehydrogenase-like NADP-dependent oxidoreductase